MFQFDARVFRNRRPALKNSFRTIPGSICAPLGFKAAAVFCDIKRIGTGKGSEKGHKRDLALIVSDVPAAVAGMFTTNQVCAAPVRVSRKVAAKNFARAIVANSGNANACTGRQGMVDAERMGELTAKSLRLKANDVLVCSTGRIGIAMPIRNVERGICECAPLLARSTSNARQVAEAIMTSDTRRKEIVVEMKIGKSTIRIGGICKGAGMIQPGMATMLAFMTSDVAIESNALKRALKTAVEQSFNRITVDSDMSTNDSVIMLANGLAENPRLESRNPKQIQIFQTALNHVCLELAKMIVRDGEGVSRFVTLHVHGARSRIDAELAARSIANSSLVRTSWCGGDPNWGRILCALGYSKAKVNEAIVDVGYSRAAESKIVWGFQRGQPAGSLGKLGRITSQEEFDIHIDLHLGRGEFVMYAADLTENYVAFNKGDVTGG